MWSILGSLSSGRRGNLGAEDRRAVWGCGGTRPRAQCRDLGQEGEKMCLQRPTRLLGGGEAVLGWGWGGVGWGSRPRISTGGPRGCAASFLEVLYGHYKLPRHSLRPHTAKFLPSSQTPSCLMKKGKMRQSQTHPSNSLNILAWE